MARQLRVEYAGAIYHVMNRGDRREPIFKDDEDRQRFLAALGEVCVKTGWQVQTQRDSLFTGQKAVRSQSFFLAADGHGKVMVVR